MSYQLTTATNLWKWDFSASHSIQAQLTCCTHTLNCWGGGLSPSSLIAWLQLVAYLDPPPILEFHLNKIKVFLGPFYPLTCKNQPPLAWTQFDVCLLHLSATSCQFFFVLFGSDHLMMHFVLLPVWMDTYLVFSVELNSIILNFKIFDIQQQFYVKLQYKIYSDYFKV